MEKLLASLLNNFKKKELRKELAGVDAFKRVVKRGLLLSRSNRKFLARALGLENRGELNVFLSELEEVVECNDFQQLVKEKFSLGDKLTIEEACGIYAEKLLSGKLINLVKTFVEDYRSRAIVVVELVEGVLKDDFSEFKRKILRANRFAEIERTLRTLYNSVRQNVVEEKLSEVLNQELINCEVYKSFSSKELLIPLFREQLERNLYTAYSFCQLGVSKERWKEFLKNLLVFKSEKVSVEFESEVIYCPICGEFVNFFSEYLREEFEDNFEYTVACLVTHYRHEHIRYYDRSWKYWWYGEKNPEYRNVSHDEYRIVVNNRAKRQLIRAFVKDPNLKLDGKKRFIEAFKSLMFNDEKTEELIDKSLKKLAATKKRTKKKATRKNA